MSINIHELYDALRLVEGSMLTHTRWILELEDGQMFAASELNTIWRLFAYVIISTSVKCVK